MPNKEPIRDPRMTEEDESRVTVAGGLEDVSPVGAKNSLERLHEELSKTSVISESFKDFIFQTALRAVDEGVGVHTPSAVEQESLRQEFVSRRFDDKSCVKLSARSLEELSRECFTGDRSGRLIGSFLDDRFPEPKDAVLKLLTGTYAEVIAVREWLWREINENPESFCDVEKDVR